MPISDKDNKILLSELSKPKEDYSDIIESFQQNDKFSDVLSPESDLVNLKPIALDIKSRLGDGRLRHPLHSGFNELDETLGFLNPGLIIIEGKKKSGKTALALQIALQAVAENPEIPVFYFAYGDSKKDLQIRALLHLAGITRSDYRKGSFSEKNIAGALGQYQEIGKRLFIVQGTQTFYANKIRDSIRNTLVNFYGNNIPTENSCVIIVDYLQEVPSVMGQNLEERMYQSTALLKDLSKLLAVPLIVIYGNNDVERLVTENEDIKVTVEKKENLDFASDVFISLIPTHVRGADKPRKDIPKDLKSYSFNVYKNKNGDEGEKTLYYSPSHSRWYESIV
jgi:replicative DNA helicase